MSLLRPGRFLSLPLVGAVLGVALAAGGCAATVGTSGSTYVPKDAAATCSAHCGDMGLQLSSVVVMANNVGCVCSVAGPAAPGGPAPGGSAAADMAALMLQEDAQRQSTSQQTAAPPSTSR
jgi:outer membrane lipoprotein SlyB